MADDTDAGLSVRQLLMMVASGDLRAVLYVFGKPEISIYGPDLESLEPILQIQT